MFEIIYFFFYDFFKHKIRWTPIYELSDVHRIDADNKLNEISYFPQHCLVVMVRQIAQLIGNESKYACVFSSLRLIGIEEGPAGLMSGLIPAVLGQVYFKPFPYFNMLCKCENDEF